MQRKVPGRDGIVLQVRPDPGTDEAAVRRVAGTVAATISRPAAALAARIAGTWPPVTATSWDPTLYLSFDDHRARPFHDLLARVGADRPAPGGRPRLRARPPHRAARRALAGRRGDRAGLVGGHGGRGPGAGDRRPSRPTSSTGCRHPDTDVVITNAVLQWVPSHLRLLPRWLAALPAGAWFALQVPGNFGAPSHALVRELLDRAALARCGWTCAGTTRCPSPAGYAELLADAGADVDVWETTYLHRLTGPDPVLEWISGTALRPVRDALPAEDYAEFRAELAPRLRAAYPARPDGTTWFPFRRIFAVAHTR